MELKWGEPGSALTPGWFLQQALARVDDLRLVRVLEMCVDTREGSLGNFGEPHPTPPWPQPQPWPGLSVNNAHFPVMTTKLSSLLGPPIGFLRVGL